jgi:hypothetical protein
MDLHLEIDWHGDTSCLKMQCVTGRYRIHGIFNGGTAQESWASWTFSVL